MLRQPDQDHGRTALFGLDPEAHRLRRRRFSQASGPNVTMWSGGGGKFSMPRLSAW